MRLLLSVASLALATTAVAQQMPLPAFGSTFTSTLTRGFSFQAPTSGVIVGLAVPNENLQANQVVEVLDFGTTGPSAWPTLTNGTQLYYDNASTAGSTIPVAIPVVAGNWYGILGACTATVGDATSHNSYGTPAGIFTSSMLGVPCDLTRFLTQSGIASNGGNQPCATESGGALGRVEVTVNSTGGGAIALAESIGDGCIMSYASMYESTTLDTWALSNTMGGIDYINSGAGYIVTAAAGAFVPVGTVDPLTVAIPGIADDSVNPAGTLGLEFSSNGFLALGAGNSNQWNPSASLFLDQPAAMFTCWADFEPNTGGTINYEEAGTRALLTYTDVYAWGTTDMNTFQFDYDSATGNCSTYFGAMASATAHPMFVGYSPAGPSLDPGSTGIEAELATAGAIVLAGSDVAPLTLSGIGRPVMDPAASVAYDAETTNIEGSALFHVGIIGLSNPSLPLSLIGFPAGCTLYAQGDVLVGPAVVAGGPGDLTWTVFNLPAASAAYNGAVFHVAAATLDLTLVSSTSRASNGVQLTLGDT